MRNTFILMPSLELLSNSLTYEHNIFHIFKLHCLCVRHCCGYKGTGEQKHPYSPTLLYFCLDPNTLLMLDILGGPSHHNQQLEYR